MRGIADGWIDDLKSIRHERSPKEQSGEIDTTPQGKTTCNYPSAQLYFVSRFPPGLMDQP